MSPTEHFLTVTLADASCGSIALLVGMAIVIAVGVPILTAWISEWDARREEDDKQGLRK